MSWCYGGGPSRIVQVSADEDTGVWGKDLHDQFARGTFEYLHGCCRRRRFDDDASGGILKSVQEAWRSTASPDTIQEFIWSGSDEFKAGCRQGNWVGCEDVGNAQ
jgi:hypothetical protein